MSKVRVLVGTKKGAFILTSDGKRGQWTVEGPLFAGWEIYHIKGSPADPNRLFLSQCSGWFGQLIQRSNDGGKTWEPVGTSGTTERPVHGRSRESGIWSPHYQTPIPFMPALKMLPSSARLTAVKPG